MEENNTNLVIKKYTLENVQFSIDNKEYKLPIPILSNLSWLQSKICHYDLKNLSLLPNLKEESEIAGIIRETLSQIKNYNIDISNNCLCISIGDGNTPRLGASMCFLTKIKCKSIDPLIKKEWLGKEPKGIKRLESFNMKIEDWIKIQEKDSSLKEIILLLLHSHALLSKFYPQLKLLYHNANFLIVSIPCCKISEIKNLKPILIKEDFGIFSPHRTIKVWRDVIA